MSNVYLTKTVKDDDPLDFGDSSIELRYEFPDNSDGRDLTNLDEVIRKFNKAVKILKAK